MSQSSRFTITGKLATHFDLPTFDASNVPLVKIYFCGRPAVTTGVVNLRRLLGDPFFVLTEKRRVKEGDDGGDDEEQRSLNGEEASARATGTGSSTTRSNMNAADGNKKPRSRYRLCSSDGLPEGCFHVKRDRHYWVMRTNGGDEGSEGAGAAAVVVTAAEKSNTASTTNERDRDTAPAVPRRARGTTSAATASEKEPAKDGKRERRKRGRPADTEDPHSDDAPRQAPPPPQQPDNENDALLVDAFTTPDAAAPPAIPVPVPDPVVSHEPVLPSVRLSLAALDVVGDVEATLGDLFLPDPDALKPPTAKRHRRYIAEEAEASEPRHEAPVPTVPTAQSAGQDEARRSSEGRSTKEKAIRPAAASEAAPEPTAAVAINNSNKAQSPAKEIVAVPAPVPSPPRRRGRPPRAVSPPSESAAATPIEAPPPIAVETTHEPAPKDVPEPPREPAERTQSPKRGRKKAKKDDDAPPAAAQEAQKQQQEQQQQQQTHTEAAVELAPQLRGQQAASPLPRHGFSTPVRSPSPSMSDHSDRSPPPRIITPPPLPRPELTQPPPQQPNQKKKKPKSKKDKSPVLPTTAATAAPVEAPAIPEAAPEAATPLLLGASQSTDASPASAVPSQRKRNASKSAQQQQQPPQSQPQASSTDSPMRSPAVRPPPTPDSRPQPSLSSPSHSPTHPSRPKSSSPPLQRQRDRQGTSPQRRVPADSTGAGTPDPGATSPTVLFSNRNSVGRPATTAAATASPPSPSQSSLTPQRHALPPPTPADAIRSTTSSSRLGPLNTPPLPPPPPAPQGQSQRSSVFGASRFSDPAVSGSTGLMPSDSPALGFTDVHNTLAEEFSLDPSETGSSSGASEYLYDVEN